MVPVPGKIKNHSSLFCEHDTILTDDCINNIFNIYQIPRTFICSQKMNIESVAWLCVTFRIDLPQLVYQSNVLDIKVGMSE